MANLPGKGPGPDATPKSPNPIDQSLPVGNNPGQVQRQPILGYTGPTASPAHGPVRAKPAPDLGTPMSTAPTCPPVAGPGGASGKVSG